MSDPIKFVTFYSYKGGVGRTSALVNTAILRANMGNKILVIDFDLEAPGTSQYLKQLDPKYEGSRPGILEYLIEAIESPAVPSIKSYAYDFSSFIDTSNGGELWVIGAGDINSPNYHKNLEKIKWSEIFELSYGELLLKNLKKQIDGEFKDPDFIFIDARTGITETGGVCTRYLANAIVILTSLNEQNISGTSNIYKELKKEQKKFILVASNIPVGQSLEEDQLFYKRLESFNSAFNSSPDVCIYNYPSLSLSELLPVLEPKRKKNEKLLNAMYRTDPLVAAYKSLALKIGGLDKDSFLRMIEQFSWQIAIGLDDDSFKKFKNRYSERYLAKILIEMDSLFTQSNLVQNVLRVDVKKFSDLSDKVSKVKNKSLQNGLRMIKQRIWSLIKEKLAVENIPMKLEWELFSDLGLFRQALEEIHKGFYEWPIDFLTRELMRAKRDDYLEIAVNAFNLGQCFERSKKGDSLKYYQVFLSAIDAYGLSKIEQKANPFFCYAIACVHLKKYDEAKTILTKAIEEVEKNKENEIFSPITYSDVSKEIFVSHINQFIKDYEHLLKL